MKCPKCAFITFDYLRECPRCNTPAPKEMEFLYPLRFRPNTPDFATEYLEALGNISLVRSEEALSAGPVEEVSLEELSREEGGVDTGLEITLEPMETQDLDQISVSLKEGPEQLEGKDLVRIPEGGPGERPFGLKLDEVADEKLESEKIPPEDELEVRLEDISQEELEVPLLRVDSDELKLTIEEEKEDKIEVTLKELGLENLKLEIEESETDELSIDIDLEESK